jgi:hypothetical protein
MLGDRKDGGEMRPGIRSAAIGMGVLSTVGVAACGSGGSHTAAGGRPGAVRAVQAAYAASTSQKTAAFLLVETIQAKSSAGSSQNATVTGSGQVDFASGSFRATVNSPSGGSVTVLRAGGTEYVQVPAAAQSQIPGHKPWVSVNLNKVSQARFGASLSQLSSVSGSDPAQALSQLAAVSSQVTKTGTVTIGGIPTTGYRAELNLNKVAAKVQAKAGAKAGQAIRQEATALGTATIPVQIWVDAHHLVRQIRYQIPIPAASTGGPAGSGRATATITFPHYGVPVQLSPPPGSQTADITSQLVQQAKNSG